MARGGEPGEAARTLTREIEDLKRLEKQLDRQFSLFGVRFGLDAVIGLAPVVGDVATAAIGLYIIWRAGRLGVGAGTQLRMLINLAIDLAAGSAPVIGDVFDLFYRSNTANLKLALKAIEKREGR